MKLEEMHYDLIKRISGGNGNKVGDHINWKKTNVRSAENSNRKQQQSIQPPPKLKETAVLMSNGNAVINANKKNNNDNYDSVIKKQQQSNDRLQQQRKVCQIKIKQVKHLTSQKGLNSLSV